jgi:hypothetical protein
MPSHLLLIHWPQIDMDESQPRARFLLHKLHISTLKMEAVSTCETSAKLRTSNKCKVKANISLSIFNYVPLSMLSRPTLGSTQPPIQWVPRALSRGYSGRGVKLTTHLQLVPRSRKCGSIHPLPHTPSWRSA